MMRLQGWWGIGEGDRRRRNGDGMATEGRVKGMGNFLKFPLTRGKSVLLFMVLFVLPPRQIYYLI